jgi:hypothetical protein
MADPSGSPFSAETTSRATARHWPDRAGPVHPYMTSSPACWSTYGRVLAAQYEDPSRMRFQQLVVDAYAVQHPGSPNLRLDPRVTQSVGIHLMTLCLFLEYGLDPVVGPDLHRRMVRRPVFGALSPPASRVGQRTCADVPLAGSAEQARAAVCLWAREVWAGWSGQHETVRGWLAAASMLPPEPNRRRTPS